VLAIVRNDLVLLNTIVRSTQYFVAFLTIQLPIHSAFSPSMYTTYYTYKTSRTWPARFVAIHSSAMVTVSPLARPRRHPSRSAERTHRSPIGRPIDFRPAHQSAAMNIHVQVKNYALINCEWNSSAAETKETHLEGERRRRAVRAFI